MQKILQISRYLRSEIYIKFDMIQDQRSMQLNMIWELFLVFHQKVRCLILLNETFFVTYKTGYPKSILKSYWKEMWLDPIWNKKFVLYCIISIHIVPRFHLETTQMSTNKRGWFIGRNCWWVIVTTWKIFCNLVLILS